MASWRQTGTAARAAIGVGGAVALAAVAWWMSREVPEPAATEPAAALLAPEAAPAAAPEPQAVQDPVAAAPVPPSFDLVRVEADGTAQVAGRGVPDARVQVLVDGAPVAEADVAGDGAFVALFTLPPNPAASLLSLVMLLPDGSQVPGRETVALAPVSGPVVAALDAAPVATVQPEPAPVAAPVAEASPPAALLVTERGVEVLQAPVAGVASVVSIDTISYTGDGQVQFGGRGEAAHVVRLYLDNAALAEVAVPEGGQWGVTKADIAPGIYTLRADQVDSAGKVTSRFETPFKRETIAALAEAAIQEAPAPDVVVAAVAPEVASPTVAAPVVSEPDAVAPAIAAAAGPTPVASPDPLAAPQPAAAAPLVGEPAPAPAVDPAAPAQTAQVAPPVVVPDPATAPEPAAVAVAPVAGAPAADPAPAPVASPVSITVQPGLTLWAIAEANFGSGIRYVQVYEANKDKIRDPDLIYPGQVFKVPAEP